MRPPGVVAIVKVVVVGAEADGFGEPCHQEDAQAQSTQT
jgi:hypothetical protein